MRMNSPEKDIISYDRIRNREKRGSAKYWILGALILAVLVYAAFFPIPTRVSRTLQAFRYDGGDLTAGTPCTVEIDGRVNRYLFRDNEFKGRIAFSTDEQTCRADADADAILQRGRCMSLFYFFDQEPLGIYAPGYLVAPTDFDWLYARLKSDGGQYVVLAGDGTAEEIAKRALDYSGQNILPTLVVSEG